MKKPNSLSYIAYRHNRRSNPQCGAMAQTRHEKNKPALRAADGLCRRVAGVPDTRFCSFALLHAINTIGSAVWT
jgi:hypothetical protein